MSLKQEWILYVCVGGPLMTKEYHLNARQFSMWLPCNLPVTFSKLAN